ncbi:magnesium transporter MgtE [Methanocalculus chunghsingensis]|uniref:Magnesium transporter MgtE n=1 Tax=Methanocalculus chunghsingensis TaxID=156457 RepID=A0A8J7WAQ3_9EURY|nr:magnesium transporter [Methanocalculus chunghsingensis]MBR1369425.1 magnesium transporter MgtE [Methanocalculus chunghsingensis]
MNQMIAALLRRHQDFLAGLVALLLTTVFASIAGIYLGSVNEILILIPGLMILVPSSINMRGAIAGILASRLSSAMHIGAFDIDYKEGSVLGDNLRATFILTVIIAAIVGMLGYIIGIAAGLDIIPVMDMILISVISGCIAGVIVTLITLIVSLATYRYSIDLDMIGAPTVTTAGDVITLPLLVITAVLVVGLPQSVRYLLLGIVILLLILSILGTLKGTDTVQSIIREGLPLLAPLCILGTIAGVVYTEGLEDLVATAALLILIPPFMNGCGAIGGIICSRLATGMHMGSIEPQLIPGREVFSGFGTNYVYTLTILPLMGTIAHYSAVLIGLDSPGLLLMVVIATGSGLIVVTGMNLLAYMTASISFALGYDPDNFGIPVVTSSIDLIGATVLIMMIHLVL